jgi:hypothetical protein
MIDFSFPVPDRDVERQLIHMPIITHVNLPNLRWFLFQGVSAYMEAVVHRITTPLLEKLRILFFNLLTFSVPRLVQFMNTTENLRFDGAKFGFCRDEVHVEVYPRGEAGVCALLIYLGCWHLD